MSDRRIICVLLLSGIAVNCAYAQAPPPPPPVIVHLAEPARGVQTITYREVWRRGDSEDDVYFGRIQDAETDSDGNLYVLDAQLNQVTVLDPSGNHLYTLGREGEGPGEFRRPQELVMLAGPRLGIVQRLPGKVICLDLAGSPAGTLVPGGDAASTAGGYRVLSGVQYRGGTLVFCGEENTGQRMIQFLAMVDDQGREQIRVLSKPRNSVYQRRLYVERDEDFVSRGRWTLGPDGRIYTAPQRDHYRIEVVSSQGEVLRIVGRTYTSRTRSAAEIEALRDAIVMMVDGSRVRIESEIEELDPAIRRLRVSDQNELWVQTAHGFHDPPAGTFSEWDVIDAEGAFDRQVRFIVPGDRKEDRLITLGEDRAILLRGYTRVQAARQAGEEESAASLDPPMVIGLQRER